MTSNRELANSEMRTTIRRGEWKDRPADKTNRASHLRGDTEPRGAGSSAKGLSPWIGIFLITLFLPWTFSLGTIALSPYRLVLILAILPVLFVFVSGKAGRLHLADILIFVFWAWCALSYLVLHGVSQMLQPSGIHFAETIGPYLLARCFIRSEADFTRMVGLLFKLIACLLPFAIVEAYSGRNVLLSMFGSVMHTFGDAYIDPRWGLRRVQSVFEHPILFGVVAGSILAPVHLVLGYQKPFMARIAKTMTIAVTAFLSLSAGPITAFTTQILLLLWNWVFRALQARWKLLWMLFAAMYVLIAMVSNQSVPAFYLTHFSFDAESANFRILIWIFGTESVSLHPWFGVGLGEWERPDWMPPSIDMFWLIYAVQHGLPAGLLLAAAFFAAFLPVSFKSGLDMRQDASRVAYSIMLTGFFIVGWTVDFWNSTYVLFWFLVGSGLWLLDSGTKADEKTRASNTR